MEQTIKSGLESHGNVKERYWSSKSQGMILGQESQGKIAHLLDTQSLNLKFKFWFWRKCGENMEYLVIFERFIINYHLTVQHLQSSNVLILAVYIWTSEVHGHFQVQFSVLFSYKWMYGVLCHFRFTSKYKYLHLLSVISSYLLAFQNSYIQLVLIYIYNCSNLILNRSTNF